MFLILTKTGNRTFLIFPHVISAPAVDCAHQKKTERRVLTSTTAAPNYTRAVHGEQLVVINTDKHFFMTSSLLSVFDFLVFGPEIHI